MCSFIVLFFRASRKDPELDILYYNTQCQFTAWIFLLPERLAVFTVDVPPDGNSNFAETPLLNSVVSVDSTPLNFCDQTTLQQVELAVNIWNLKVN